MEEPQPQTLHYGSTVDTSRPFRSVKEAVAVFGERLLVGEISSPATAKPQRQNSWRFTPSPTTKGEDDNKGDRQFDDQTDNNKNKNKNKNNSGNGVLETLRKLEAELEETKVELKLLKERESETEVALATLNAELHKNMSKLARAEAAAAGKAAATATKTVRFDDRENQYKENGNNEIVREEEKEEKKKKKKETLAQILSVGDYNLGGKIRERKTMMKKKIKPIIPLVGDLLFSKKKDSPNNNHTHTPLFASSFFYNWFFKL